MKTNFKLFSLFALMIMLLFSCSDKDSDGGATALASPFLTITAEDGNSLSDATINDNTHTIWIPFRTKKDLINSYVTFNLAKGAKMVSPANTIAILDLTGDKTYPITVNDGVQDVMYNITAAQPVDTVLTSVTAKDGNGTCNAIIDEKNHKIYMQFTNETDITNSTVTFNIHKGASIVTPTSSVANMDLSSTPTIRMNNGIEEVDYKIIAANANEATCQYDTDWSDVTSSFITDGSTWIKAYKTITSAGVSGAIANILVFDQDDVKMCVQGSGNTGSSISTASRIVTVSNANPAWPLIMSGIYGWESPTYVKSLMVKQQGVIFQEPNYTCPPTLGITADGKINIKYAEVKDGVIYGSDDPATVSDRTSTIWNVTGAISGYSLLVHKGMMYSEYTTLTANDGRWEASDDDACKGRLVIGLTDNNKIYIYSCEGVYTTTGLTMKQVATILRNFGCKEVMQLNYGDGAFAYLNKICTVRTGSLYNTTTGAYKGGTGGRSQSFILFAPK